MDRRRFLTASTVGASAAALGAGATLEGCASSGLRLDQLLRGLDAGALVARLQRGVQRLREHPFGSIVRGPPAARPDLTEHVFRQTLESLMVLDVLRAVPDGAPLPPELARAVAPMLPVLDRSTHTHHALLRTMPDSQRRQLDQRVRAQPDLVLNATEWVDERAGELGVPMDNRLRLRSAAVSAGTRIRRQSTSAVVDDCVARLDALLDRYETRPPAAQLAGTNAVALAMWQAEEARDGSARRNSGRAKDGPRPAGAPPDPNTTIDAVPARFGAPWEMTSPTEPVQWSPYWASPGDGLVRTGAILMPFGLITCGVTLIIGIIVLAVGASRNNNWDGRTTEQP
jgi:hypothetical protein